MGQQSVRRLSLQNVLKDILGSDAVYFQPPPNVQMTFPCIIYKRDFLATDHANNSPYKNKRRYQVTVVHRDPDNEITEKMEQLPLCSYERFFTVDNLNHDVYNLYF